MITRPALRYYGGKWRMGTKIISHFPLTGAYGEPCFGGGSVLLQKGRTPVETVNDIDGNVVNFFKVLRDRAEELVLAIKLTPWARDEINLMPDDANDPIEKARRFWAQCWMTIAQTERNQSFRVSKSAKSQPAKIMTEVDYLHAVAERLSGVQIENMDALDFIGRYDTPDTLFYFDPPYTKDTRSRADEYKFEVTTEFHIKAYELLNEISGVAVVSGYRSDLYDELYASWARVDIDVLANSGQTKTESLWIHPRIKPEKALPMFAFMNGGAS